ncbi:MAG: glycerate kinase [Nocardioides sp.]
MRVLIAPDKFAGTLTALQAAEAISAGWQRQAPGDELDLAPMSDGGPGFVAVLHTALGGEVLSVTVPGPLRETVPAAMLLVGAARTSRARRPAGCTSRGVEPESATTYGVGAMIGRAVEAGARRVVVGMGGSGTTDGGAGLLAALGADSDVDLDAGRAR